MRVHLDTDLGSDPDDACALAMLLGWPGVDLVGITTSDDPGAVRAGLVRRCLETVGRTDIPVVAGAEGSLTTLDRAIYVPDDERFDERYWPDPVSPLPAPPGAALDRLARSIEQGATVVAVGPYTNLALLQVARPGLLDRVPVVAMGGWVHPLGADLPDWGPDRDWNVQCDPWAAEIVATIAGLTLVPLAATTQAPLRATEVPRLRRSGRLGELLANQSEAHAADGRLPDLARAHAGLPDDPLNFHHDPHPCGVALGWPGATVEQVSLRPVRDPGGLRFDPADDGHPTRVVTDVDGAAFAELWLTAVEAAQTLP